MKTFQLSPAQVSQILNKSPKAVVRLILAGELPAIRLRRTYRVSEEDLDIFLANSQVVPSVARSPEFQHAVDEWEQEAAERECEDFGT
jgi:excisionase family DNA binding protein